MHDLAGSDEQYEHWMSFEEGSFFSIYDDWFGLPCTLVESTQCNNNETYEIERPTEEAIDRVLEIIMYGKPERQNIQSFLEDRYP